MSNEVLYHYTTGSIFRQILNQGAIEPSRSEPDNPKEVPTVTFSSNPVWENTRYRVGRLPNGEIILMSKVMLQRFDGGLYRIVVPKEIAPLTWRDMKDQCGMSQDAIKGIYDFALQVGARTSHWFATKERVPEDVWITVQKLNDQDEWIDLTDEEIPEADASSETSIVELSQEAVALEL